MDLPSLYIGLAVGFAAAIFTTLLGAILDRIWDYLRNL